MCMIVSLIKNECDHEINFYFLRHFVKFNSPIENGMQQRVKLNLGC